MKSKGIAKKRSGVIAEMEKLLILWLENQPTELACVDVYVAVMGTKGQ